MTDLHSSVIDKLEDVENIDLICCLNVLDCCTDPYLILSEIHRALASDDRAVIALVLPYTYYVETSKTIHLYSSIFFCGFSIVNISLCIQIRQIYHLNLCCHIGWTQYHCHLIKKQNAFLNNWNRCDFALKHGLKHHIYVKVTYDNRSIGSLMWLLFFQRNEFIRYQNKTKWNLNKQTNERNFKLKYEIFCFYELILLANYYYILAHNRPVYVN